MNFECDEGYFCKKDVGDCDNLGTCQPRPEYCLEYYDPVCGCDGEIYPNECYAYREGINIKSKDCE